MKNLKKSLVFLSIGVLILAVYQGQGVQKKNPSKVTIEIDVINGEVKCNPDPAEAEFGDIVKWICDYEFTVDFGDKKPLKKIKLKAKYKAKKYETDEPDGEVTTKEAKKKNKVIRYKYSVEVLYKGKKLKVDPDLDIRP
jgi:hypothetical protein